MSSYQNLSSKIMNFINIKTSPKLRRLEGMTCLLSKLDSNYFKCIHASPYYTLVFSFRNMCDIFLLFMYKYKVVYPLRIHSLSFLKRSCSCHGIFNHVMLLYFKALLEIFQILALLHSELSNQFEKLFCRL